MNIIEKVLVSLNLNLWLHRAFGKGRIVENLVKNCFPRLFWPVTLWTQWQIVTSHLIGWTWWRISVAIWGFFSAQTLQFQPFPKNLLYSQMWFQTAQNKDYIGMLREHRLFDKFLILIFSASILNSRYPPKVEKLLGSWSDKQHSCNRPPFLFLAV